MFLTIWTVVCWDPAIESTPDTSTEHYNAQRYTSFTVHSPLSPGYELRIFEGKPVAGRVFDCNYEVREDQLHLTFAIHKLATGARTWLDRQTTHAILVADLDRLDLGALSMVELHFVSVHHNTDCLSVDAPEGCLLKTRVIIDMDGERPEVINTHTRLQTPHELEVKHFPRSGYVLSKHGNVSAMNTEAYHQKGTLYKELMDLEYEQEAFSYQVPQHRYNIMEEHSILGNGSLVVNVPGEEARENFEVYYFYEGKQEPLPHEDAVETEASAITIEAERYCHLHFVIMPDLNIYLD